MAYSISVELKPNSKDLREFLRQNGFHVYGQNYFGEFTANFNNQSDESGKWLSFTCIRSGQLSPPQAVIKRIDDELIHGAVMSYNISVQK